MSDVRNTREQSRNRDTTEAKVYLSLFKKHTRGNTQKVGIMF